MERIIIFIDGSNFYHALKRSFGTAAIDFGKLAQILTGECKLIRNILGVCEDESSGNI